MSYDLYPSIPIKEESAWVSSDVDEIAGKILKLLSARRGTTLVLEEYPGARNGVVDDLIDRLSPKIVIDAEEALIDREAFAKRIEPILTDDRVFGRMYYGEWTDFFDRDRLEELRDRLNAAYGIRVIRGVAASEIAAGDVVVYVDITRWEITLRHRAGMANYHTDNGGVENSRKFKQGYFFEWRMADKVKRRVLPTADFYIDADDADALRMIEAPLLFKMLERTVCRPFRLAPYFDPGVWGGKWMQEKFGLDPEKPNFAWSFDGVPEENSLIYVVEGTPVHVPAINLVFFQPVQLLGRRVYARYGAEFPIRFDLLDTMDGGNLSLQVHPRMDIIHNEFGMSYTQDESYYLLDAGEDACVYLGLKTDAKEEDMFRDLRAADRGEILFDAEKYINRIPAKKHDHFLIPAGTVHCSGRNSMVLEISATPYIFTMKMWDWGRVDLDGRARPVHLDLGQQSIEWSRRTDWVHENIVNHVKLIHSGEDYTEEVTGLHELESIVTRRYRVKTSCDILNDEDTVNVLNLTEGDEAIIESPEGLFAPFTVHAYETFIIPAAVSAYRIRAVRGEAVVIRATVR